MVYIIKKLKLKSINKFVHDTFELWCHNEQIVYVYYLIQVYPI